MNQPQKIVLLLDKLINDAQLLLEDITDKGYIKDVNGMRKWSNELILFKSISGGMINPWINRLNHDGKVLVPNYLKEILSSLNTIKYAINENLLTSYREIIISDAFGNLYEQGEYLFNQGYFLASGVIFRAVIEEQLRELCEKENCLPQKKIFSINDLNNALYQCETINYNKSTMLQVNALAAVGNDAAHNNPELKKDDVKRLMHGTLDFISKYASN